MKIKRKTLEGFKKWFFISSIIFCIVSIWYVYYKTTIFTIQKYAVTGIAEEYIPRIENALTLATSTYTYGLIPNNKVLSYSNAAIIQTITELLPEAASISIRPSGLHTLKITITEYQPLFRIDETTGLTKEGVFFRTTKDIKILPLVTFASSTKITHTEGGIVVRSFQNIDSTFLLSLRDFEKNVTSAIFPVYVISIDNEEGIALIDKRGVSRVLIPQDGDTKKLWSTLLSAIDTDPLKKKLLENISSLEYLDVRYGNKVFYKFSNTSFQNSKDTGILEGYEHATSTSR